MIQFGGISTKNESTTFLKMRLHQKHSSITISSIAMFHTRLWEPRMKYCHPNNTRSEMGLTRAPVLLAIEVGLNDDPPPQMILDFSPHPTLPSTKYKLVAVIYKSRSGIHSAHIIKPDGSNWIYHGYDSNPKYVQIVAGELPAIRAGLRGEWKRQECLIYVKLPHKHLHSVD